MIVTSPANVWFSVGVYMVQWQVCRYRIRMDYNGTYVFSVSSRFCAQSSAFFTYQDWLRSMRYVFCRSSGRPPGSIIMKSPTYISSKITARKKQTRVQIAGEWKATGPRPGQNTEPVTMRYGCGHRSIKTLLCFSDYLEQSHMFWGMRLDVILWSIS